MPKAEMGLPFSYHPVVVASEDDFDINDCPYLLAAMKTSNLNQHVDLSAAGIQSPTHSATMAKTNLADQGTDKLGVEIRGGEMKFAPPSKSHVICQNLNSSSFFDDMSKGMSTFTAGTVSLLGQYRGKREESVDTFVCFTARVFTLAYLTCMHKPLALTLRHVFALVKHLLCFLFMVLCLISSQTVPPKPAVPSSVKRSRVCRSGNHTHYVYWTLMFLFALFSQGSAAISGPVTTNQKLPPVCVAWFTVYKNDCPIKADSWNNEWEDLNTKCCSGFPGTVLVCQRGHDPTGDSYNFPACLADKLVPDGHFGNLTIDTQGSPRLLVLPCNASTEFEDEERMSSDITFPHCKPKSKCDSEGQELLCKSDSSQDDLCTCAVGFSATSPSCEKGFTQNDGCMCEKQFCPSGLVPARTTLPPEPRMCSKLSPGFAVQSDCIKPTTSPVPSTHRRSLVTILRTATPANGLPAESSTTPIAVPLGTAPPDQPRSDEGHGKLDTVDIAFRGLGLSALVIFALGLFFLVSVGRGWIG